MADQLSVHFRDEDNHLATHRYSIRDDQDHPGAALVVQFLDAIDGVSNAGIDKVGVLNDMFVADASIANPYDSEDKLMVTLQGASQAFKIALPAPDRLFMAQDDESADEASAQWQLLKLKLIEFLVTATGEAILAVIKSKRARLNRSA